MPFSVMYCRDAPRHACDAHATYSDEPCSLIKVETSSPWRRYMEPLVLCPDCRRSLAAVLDPEHAALAALARHYAAAYRAYDAARDDPRDAGSDVLTAAEDALLLAVREMCAGDEGGRDG